MTTPTTNSKDAEKLLRLTGDVEKDGSLAQALMEVTGYKSVTPLARLISPTDLDAWVSRIRCALMCRYVTGEQTTLPDMTKKMLDPNYKGPGKRNILGMTPAQRQELYEKVCCGVATVTDWRGPITS